MTHHHPDDLAAALTRQAQGGLCAEAAAMVIAGQRTWLARDDFVAAYLDTFPALGDATTMAVIDWDGALAAIDTATLVCSSGEEQMLRIAASLAAGAPIDLSSVLTGLDNHNLGVVLAAIAHAGGATTAARTPRTPEPHPPAAQTPCPNHHNCMLSHTL